MLFEILTIDEKINYKDYFKGYCFKDSKNGYFILKQDINDFAINHLYNRYCHFNNICIVDEFIKDYGIFQPYMK